jgi:tetratricopeptide (TPR) repeat protein
MKVDMSTNVNCIRKFRFLARDCDLKRVNRTRAILKISVYALALCASITFLAGCRGDPAVRKQKYFESGRHYHETGKFKEAAIQFSNALRIDKNYAEAHYGLAQTYAQLGQFSASYQELRRTVDLQPTNYPARLDLASMLLAGGQLAEAERQTGIVAAAEPDNASMHALLSAIAHRKGQDAVALTEVRRALQLDASRSSFHIDLALLLMENPSKMQEVENELKQAVSLNVRSMNARVMLIALYEKQQRWTEAEQTAQDAIHADPTSISARQALARTLLRDGKQARAEDVLRQASHDLGTTPLGNRMLADYYAESGQAEKASAEFASVAAKYPNDLPAQQGYAWALLQANETAKARELIAKLSKNHPGNPDVEGLVGVVQLNDGNPAEAVNSLLNSVKNSPNNAVFQYWLGRAALDKADLELAEQSLRNAARLNPSWLEPRQKLAHLASLRGDLSLLTDVADETIAAFPNAADGYIWRGIAEMMQNSPGAAEADLKAAIRISPEKPDAYLQLGKLCFAQKRFAEGVDLLENALRRDPVSIEALRLLTARDLMRNQPQAAFARLMQTVDAHPRNSAVYDLLARLQMHVGNLTQAASTAEAAMHINPNDADAVQLLAEIETRRGQIPSAIAAWEQWLRLHPRDAGAMALVGALEQSRGNVAKAESYYKKSLQVQPTNPIAANNLAYLMLEQGGNVDIALTAAQTARQAMPDSPNTADTLAWAYYHKGIYGLARDLLEDAVRTAPESATMHFHLGMVYSRLKDRNRAALHLRRALSLAPHSAVAGQATQALKVLG